MNKEFGYNHLDVYQKALGILDTASGLPAGGTLAPLFTAKAAETVTAVIDAQEAWPAENRKEGFFRARHIAHQLAPFIEVASRNGLIKAEEAARLAGEAESVSKMLYALAKASGPKKEESPAA